MTAERRLILGLIVLVAGLAIASIGIGPVDLASGDVLAGLFGRGDAATILIVQEIRLPRAILGAVIGAGLGASGAVLQGFLRNPLADPGVIGVSTTAGLGAVIAFYSGAAAAWSLALPLGAMAGAVVGVALLFALCGREAGPLTLVLAGAGISSFAAALTSLVLSLAPSPFAAAEIVFWMLGSLTDRSLDHVALAVPPILLGIVILWRTGRALDALTLGERVAASLGISLNRTRVAVIAGTALAVGAGVAVAGAIGFVGLAIPHLLRPLVGHQPSRLIGVSGLGGAALVLAADILVRVLPTTAEIKLGVVTALIGAPLFLVLVLRLRRQGEPDA
jgi:iron complex transport system permease protein